jgi:shikimate kinase
VLIGARGAGKSSAGARAAPLLGRAFSDLDRLTSPAEPAGELLARLGERAFRERELAALERLCAGGEPALVAAGGGVVEIPAARALLRLFARCIWLRAPAAVLRTRLAADPTPRPALLGTDPLGEIEALLERRTPLYQELASAIVDAGAPLDEVVEGIVQAVRSPAV